MVFLCLLTLLYSVCAVLGTYSINQDDDNLPDNLVYDVAGQKDFLKEELCSQDFSGASNLKLTNTLYWRLQRYSYEELLLPENVYDYLNSLEQALNYEGVYTEMAMLLASSDVCKPANLNMSTTPIPIHDAVGILEIPKNKSNTVDHCRIICNVLKNLRSSYQEDFGINIDDKYFDCMLSLCKGVLKNTGYLILAIEPKEISTFLVYAGFQRMLNSFYNKRQKQWRKVNSQGKLFINIQVYQGDLGFLLIDPLTEFLQKFSARWLKNEYSAEPNIHIIIECPERFQYSGIADNENHKAITYPKIPFAGLTQKNDHSVSNCSILKSIKATTAEFTTYVMEVDNWESSEVLITNCEPHVIFSADENVHVLVYGEENLEFLERLQNQSKNLHHIFPSLIFLKTENASGDIVYVHSIERVQYNDSSATNTVKLPLIILPKTVLLTQEDIFPVLHKLEHLLQIKINLEYDYPDATFLIEFEITETPFGQNFTGKNLYCSENLIKTKELQEALIAWASIHNFTLIPFPVFDTTSVIGWNYNVVTDSKLKNDSYFSVVVRRNVPYNFKNRQHVCVDKYTNYYRIPYEREIYAGVTLNLDQINQIVSLNETHIQNLLMVASIRHRVMEVIVEDSNLLDTVLRVLKSDLRDTICERISRKPEDVVMNLRLDYSLTSFSIWQMENILSFSPKEIHLTNWENIEIEDQMKFLEQIPSFLASGIEVALSVTDCIQEINSGLSSLKNTLLLNSTQYVVCPFNGLLISDFEADEERVQIFLDTLLYIQWYINYALEKDTYFQISFNITNCEQYHESFNRFAYTASQYANMYKLQIFVGDAYLNCSEWKITNYKDLLNTASYALKPYGEHPNVSLFEYISPPGNDDSDTLSLPLAVGVPVGSFSSFSALFMLFMYCRRRKKVLLSKEEMRLFRNGRDSKEASEDNKVNTEDWNSLGFNPDFEISKQDFVIGTEIGKGNFGLVCEGLYKENITVAIKMPNPECPKEAFRTLLSETKILSYIGKHENVLKFIGAYTKEIEVGIIYILTEFCEHKTLESYLKAARDHLTLDNVSESTFSVEEIAMYIDSSSEQEYSYQSDSSDPVNTKNPRYGYTTFGDPEPVQNARSDQPISFIEMNRFALEIAGGMEYIAARKVIHSDLSTRNVLLDNNHTCKIADFGLSRKLYQKAAYIKEGEEALPWRWMALESLKNMEFTTKSDVWSYAVTLWEIFSLGGLPYSGIVWDPSFTSTLERGLRLSKREYATEKIYQKMQFCWNSDPKRRPSFAELQGYFETLMQEYKNYATK